MQLYNAAMQATIKLEDGTYTTFAFAQLFLDETREGAEASAMKMCLELYPLGTFTNQTVQVAKIEPDVVAQMYAAVCGK